MENFEVVESRKLAYISIVESVEAIPDADRIEKVRFKGWIAVAKKGEFSVGDKVVLFEADSILPEQDRYSFLGSAKNYDWLNVIGWRIRTQKLRGVISQCLALPLVNFPELEGLTIEEGLNLTEILNITKFEPKRDKRGNVIGQLKGTFPSFIRKTDQERIQNLSEELLTKETFEVTVKRDGSSATYFVKDGTFGYCSRNLELKWAEDFNEQGEKNPKSVWQQIAERFDIPNKLKSYGKNIAIQGEIFGENIQSNFENIKGVDFEVYDVFDIDKQEYLLPIEAREVTKKLKLKYVPILSACEAIENEALTITEIRDKLVNLAEGTRFNDGKGYREGIVYKSNTTPFSFKVISLMYSLKEK